MLRKLFLENSNVFEKIKEMYFNISLKKSEKFMDMFDLIDTVCDNSYKLGEIRTIAAHIIAGELIRKNMMMFMNVNLVQKKGSMNRPNSNCRKGLSSTKLMEDTTIRSGTWVKLFKSIKKKCDNSYKLGEIRTTATHIDAGKLKKNNLWMLRYLKLRKNMLKEKFARKKTY
jgi:hypothetical protein